VPDAPVSSCRTEWIVPTAHHLQDYRASPIDRCAENGRGAGAAPSRQARTIEPALRLGCLSKGESAYAQVSSPTGPTARHRPSRLGALKLA